MIQIPAILPEYVLNFFIPFMRVSAMLMALPIIGTKLVPTKIRLILAILLTLSVALATSNLQSLQFSQNTPFTLIIINAIYQITVGVMFGLVIHIIFQAMVMAGQIIAMQMGLGFASLNDPQNGVSVPTVSQFYMLMATLLYLSMNGHLFLINALIKSFEVIPVMQTDFKRIALSEIAELGAFMFSYGLSIALPAVVTLLITNISFGIMTKSAPQINIFSIGFTISMMVGIASILISLYFFEANFNKTSEYIHSIILDFI